MKNCFIHDRTLDTFFRTHTDDSKRPDAATKAEADLYTEAAAVAITRAHYGPHGFLDGKWQLIEATVPEFLSWRGRLGGRVKSDKKARNARRNGRKNKGA